LAVGRVRFPIAFGDQDLDGLPGELGALESEQGFGLAIDQDDAARIIDDDHGVRRGLDQLAKELVAV
jgi:hypothetical protein